MGLLGVARANTAVGVSPETFLLLLLQSAHPFLSERTSLRVTQPQPRIVRLSGHVVWKIGRALHTHERWTPKSWAHPVAHDHARLHKKRLNGSKLLSELTGTGHREAANWPPVAFQSWGCMRAGCVNKSTHDRNPFTPSIPPTQKQNDMKTRLTHAVREGTRVATCS
jgi:hypothetical protein